MAPNVWQIGAKVVKGLTQKQQTFVRKSIVWQTFQLKRVFSDITRSSHQMSDQMNGTVVAEEPMRRLLWSKLSDAAHGPTRGSERSAGYDLYSAYDCVVPARGKQLVKTDIAIAVPTGCYGRIAARSGLAWKHSIDVGAGVVDEDYRGNVGIVLFNLSDEDFSVRKGDRIAQLICERIAATQLEECPQLDATIRNDKGFGSTGVSLSPHKHCNQINEITSN